MGGRASNGEFTVAADWVVDAVRWGVPTTALALMILGARNRRVFPPPFAAGLVLIFGCSCLTFTGSRCLSDGVIGPDGKTYVFFRFSLFQLRTGFLARVTHDRVLWQTVEPIASQEGELGSNHGSVIRPSYETRDDREWVAMTSDGYVLGLQGSRAYRAAKVGASESVSPEELVGLSPFALLGPTGTGNESDLAEMVRIAGLGVGPRETELLMAMAHANPWVRAAARRIVAAGGAALYPEATKRIAAEPK